MSKTGDYYIVQHSGRSKRRDSYMSITVPILLVQSDIAVDPREDQRFNPTFTSQFLHFLSERLHSEKDLD